MPGKKSILDFYKMKAEGEKITFITSYDYPTAQFAQAAGIDMILVGDSLGMCVYGYPSTIPVKWIRWSITRKLSGGARPMCSSSATCPS